MRYAIKKNDGSWWGGACWGFCSNRKIYTREELPAEIDGAEVIG